MKSSIGETGFPGGASGKEPTCQCWRRKRPGLDPRVGKIPWRRKWQPTPVLLPGESHGWRSLVGCSHRISELDTTEVTQRTHTRNLDPKCVLYLSTAVHWTVSLRSICGGAETPVFCIQTETVRLNEIIRWGPWSYGISVLIPAPSTRRGYLSTSQEEGLTHPEPVCGGILTLDIQPPELRDASLCGLRHPVCGILFWFPKLTNINVETFLHGVNISFQECKCYANWQNTTLCFVLTFT